MKLKPKTSSTQAQTFDPWNLRGRLPMTPVWKYGKRLIRPNPPTPEAVAKAQFVDKTYKWTGR